MLVKACEVAEQGLRGHRTGLLGSKRPFSPQTGQISPGGGVFRCFAFARLGGASVLASRAGKGGRPQGPVRGDTRPTGLDQGSDRAESYLPGGKGWEEWRKSCRHPRCLAKGRMGRLPEDALGLGRQSRPPAFFLPDGVRMARNRLRVAAERWFRWSLPGQRSWASGALTAASRCGRRRGEACRESSHWFGVNRAR